MKKFTMIILTFILSAMLFAGCRGNTSDNGSMPGTTNGGMTNTSVPVATGNPGNDTGMVGQIIGR